MQILTEPQLSIFSERLPHRPYCSDDLQYGLQIRPLQTALERRFIQYNSPASINWLTFDIDRVYCEDSEWAIIAPPNIAVRNPANGHAHLLYGIAAPVSKTAASRPAPLRLLSAINEGFRHALGADTGFTELICKNPLHPHWTVTTPRTELYDLGELAEWVDLDASDRRVRATPKRSQVGLGRNCNLFNALRTWAYRWVKDYQGGPLERWHEAVLDKAERLNTFNDPLPYSEIKATARSCAKWTWNTYTGRATAATLAEDGLNPETFSLLQSNLGQMGNLKRWGDSTDKKAQALQLRAGGMLQAEIAEVMSVTVRTVRRWLLS
jgi:hypothetical protein